MAAPYNLAREWIESPGTGRKTTAYCSLGRISSFEINPSKIASTCLR